MKQKIAFALSMGSITTGIISFILIFLNIGFSDKFLRVWLKSWGISYLIIIPAILIIGPILQKRIEKIFGDK
ncbi:DUF2798 domain-containing protein [Flavobacterium sp. F52]|uniref:DUF2798 domain-containing protein n=1 Tax=Flavobacterium sp. F52 TaxID=1202532 RepID=UPI0002730CBB|nr:DUF2798 domain-containing protein [Flavobacterium sp. F52]EJG02066.1 hypothetical protein FF52_08659 [Flavobacterium sp. F52]